MTDQKNAPELSEALNKALGDPAIGKLLSGLMGEGESGEKSMADGIGKVLSDPALMAKLPDMVAALSAMPVGGDKSAPSPKKDAASRRMALLYALKPYLSPRRCEAIDYFARMSRMGDLVKNFKPQ